jgi:hypothetical protein
MNTVKSVRVYSYEGRFNFANNAKQLQLVAEIRTDAGALTVSDLWDLDPEYRRDQDEVERIRQLEDADIEEAVNFIEARIKHYIYTTNREQNLKKIQQMRELIPQALVAALENKIMTLRESLEDAECRLEAAKMVLLLTPAAEPNDG